MRYKTIVADPPWPIHTRHIVTPGWNNGGRELPMEYPLMSYEEINALDVRALAAQNSRLFLWGLSAGIREAYTTAEAWGFRVAQLLIWAKPRGGMGPGGTFVNTVEPLLFCVRGKTQALQRVNTTWFDWPRPAKHSRKPDAFYDMVESVSSGPYLEMFSRRGRLGWDVWGNEVDTEIEMGSR